jgi:hypothetical protein
MRQEPRASRATICALKGQFKKARGSAPGTRDRREIFALKGQVKPTRNKHLDSCITIGAGGTRRGTRANGARVRK